MGSRLSFFQAVCFASAELQLQGKEQTLSQESKDAFFQKLSEPLPATHQTLAHPQQAHL